MSPAHGRLPESARPIGVALAAVLVFCLPLIASLHDPRPTTLNLGVALPEPAVQRLTTLLADAPFDVEIEPGSAAGIEQAVRRGHLDGGLIPDPAGASLEVIVAGGSGGPNVAAVTEIGNRIATGFGGSATVRDVAPTAAGDSLGHVAFLVLLSTTLTSVGIGAAAGLAGSGSHLSRIGSVLGAVVVLAVGVTWVATGLTGALAGHALLVFAFSVVLATVVGGTTAALATRLGPVGALLGALTFVLVAVPAAGGPFGRDSVPAAMAWIGSVLPLGHGVEALRTKMYLDAGAPTQALAVLGIWTMVSLTLLVVWGRPRTGEAWDVDATASAAPRSHNMSE